MRYIIVAGCVLGMALQAHAYEKDGSVVVKSGGSGVAVDTTSPQSMERSAGPGPVVGTAPAAKKPGKAPVAAEPPAGEPLGYASGGGVQTPGGVRTCHVRGFREPDGLIVDDYYQKCGTVRADGVTVTCYADGRCRVSY